MIEPVTVELKMHRLSHAHEGLGHCSRPSGAGRCLAELVLANLAGLCGIYVDCGGVCDGLQSAVFCASWSFGWSTRWLWRYTIWPTSSTPFGGIFWIWDPNKKRPNFCDSFPIGSMYGIYTNIWGILMVNVTIYSSTMDPMGLIWHPKIGAEVLRQTSPTKNRDVCFGNCCDPAQTPCCFGFFRGNPCWVWSYQTWASWSLTLRQTPRIFLVIWHWNPGSKHTVRVALCTRWEVKTAKTTTFALPFWSSNTTGRPWQVVCIAAWFSEAAGYPFSRLYP